MYGTIFREMDSNHTFDGNIKPPVTANGDKPKMERPQCHTCFEDYGTIFGNYEKTPT